MRTQSLFASFIRLASRLQVQTVSCISAKNKIISFHRTEGKSRNTVVTVSNVSLLPHPQKHIPMMFLLLALLGLSGIASEVFFVGQELGVPYYVYMVMKCCFVSFFLLNCCTSEEAIMRKQKCQALTLNCLLQGSLLL